MSQNQTAEQEEPLPTTPTDLFNALQSLDIEYKLHHHPAFYTVEEGLEFEKNIPGLHCRNLFLRDKKKKMFLLTAANETAIDLKKLPDLLDCARLSFGSPDRLWEHLGIRPGSVSPFCMMNDTDKNVQAIIDAGMMEADIINVHPLDNTMTIGLSPQDLLRFLEHYGHAPAIMDLTPASPDPT